MLLFQWVIIPILGASLKEPLFGQTYLEPMVLVHCYTQAHPLHGGRSGTLVVGMNL